MCGGGAVEAATPARVKTDAKDALHLARLLRLVEVSPVAVPTVTQEAPGLWSGSGRTCGVI